jgi:hypothetical protein
MGWFGKSKHERQADGLVRVLGNLYTMTNEGRHGAPVVLVFQRHDARFQHLMFCLCTAHVACARLIGNPDAVLNDVIHRAVEFALSDQQTFFGGAVQPQQAANDGAARLQEYMHRWSAYVDMIQGPNRAAATGLVCGMMADVEGRDTLTDRDARRLLPLATWIEDQLDTMRIGFPR